MHAAEEVTVVADIGPYFLIQSALENNLEKQNAKEYLALVEIFLELGADEFLFETQQELTELLPALELIQRSNPEAITTVSFSVNQNGYTRTGLLLRDLLAQAEKIEQVKCTGINCQLGPTQLSQVFAEHSKYSKFSFFAPNSGLPERDLGLNRSEAEAKYFARSCYKAWEHGANQLGGCCGTNPIDIKALSDLYTGKAEPIRPTPKLYGKPNFTSAGQSKVKQSWYEKLLAGEQIIAIEYDTPVKAEVDLYLKKISELKAAGMDLMTIADNPNGQTRIDSALMAARIKSQLNVEVLPHFTCRDRNLSAIHSLLLGISTCGVHQALAVTGDPIPLEDRNQIKSVFNVNSQSLLRYISQLNQELAQPFILAAALNVNAPRFEAELNKAKRKVESGAQVFLTQPIFTKRAKENLAYAKQELDSHTKFLAGVMPLVSQKNALFMKYEMSGIDIPDEIISRYENLSRDEAEMLALEISYETMEKLAPITDGFYLITPFQRTHLTAKLCREWKDKQ